MHRTFLSLQLSQASRFEIPLCIVDAGAERVVGPLALPDEPGLLPGPLLGRPTDSMFPWLGLVHDEGFRLLGEDWEDMKKASDRCAHEEA